MEANQKIPRDPCNRVLDWFVQQSDTTRFERIAARTIREHGVNGAFQERVLADACRASGMRDVCRHADECEIGEVERRPPAIPGHRLPAVEGTEA